MAGFSGKEAFSRPGRIWARPHYLSTWTVSYLKVLVDDTKIDPVIPGECRSGLGFIPCEYKWEFPILYPALQPDDNIWFVSLCADKSCYDPSFQSQDIIPVIFPMPGFAPGEASPEVLFFGKASSIRGGSWILAAFLHVAAMVGGLFILY